MRGALLSLIAILTSASVLDAQIRVGTRSVLEPKQLFEILPPVLDAYASRTRQTSIVLQGRAPRAWRVEAVQRGNRTSHAVVGGRFTIRIKLTANRKNLIFLQSVSEERTRSRPVLAAILHDAEPPTMFVDQPAASAVVRSRTVDVFGRIGDRLSGSQGLRVNVQ